MNTFEAAEILLKEAILSYEKYGITQRVSFKDVAKDKSVDTKMAENGVNHLFFLKLINLDTGGNYYLNPEKLHDVLPNFQNNSLSNIIFNTNIITLNDNATFVQNIGSSSFKQEFIKQVENNLPDNEKSLWGKIKQSSLLDLFITIVKKFTEFD